MPTVYRTQSSTLYLLIAQGEVEIVKMGAATLILTISLRDLIERQWQCQSAEPHFGSNTALIQRKLSPVIGQSINSKLMEGRGVLLVELRHQ
jgi:hypothetical protein